jgi:diguanylate cyclase (GGDEF)-like protein
LKELATKDPLTGLYNRRHFSEVMSHEFAAAERYDQDMTVLMLDLDYFKQINDQHGHAAGDEVLHALADAIKGSLRESDVGARFGGDEFILLLPQTSSHSASALANRVVNLYKQKMERAFPYLPASVSIGAASLRHTRATSWENLIHEADVAMYNTKQAGRKSRDQLASTPAPADTENAASASADTTDPSMA